MALLINRSGVIITGTFSISDEETVRGGKFISVSELRLKLRRGYEVLTVVQDNHSGTDTHSWPGVVGGINNLICAIISTVYFCHCC
jgi:hypothetical protein